jgi:hypothetical protein
MRREIMSSADLLPGTPYDDSGLLRPPAAAVGLSAIRGLPDGSMRQYTSVEFTRGWNGVERFIRTLRAVGYIKPSSAAPSYAVLDVLDVDGDIIGDYDVPTAAAFRYIKRKLDLRVEVSDSPSPSEGGRS